MPASQQRCARGLCGWSRLYSVKHNRRRRQPGETRAAAARKTHAADMTKGRNPALDEAPGSHDLAWVAAAHGRRTGTCWLLLDIAVLRYDDIAVLLAWANAPATMTACRRAYALATRC
ncbi:hypothetical protein RSPO_c01883 [Ralstonia solanacearum Po82]|uniref:Uncharacterized protein n=1 Tax=Ralstonia solanacearum (strain Po82) TaxID=1031711 RepID=F6G1P8_RALS8|nr:hypothetical protein RSPO_c01883 [Ralstonia solanacearum Po82]